MAFERISLNIIPDGEMPVFHASQFDAGRPIIIDLYNGEDVYTPAAGVTFELHCRKVDDNIVTLDTYEVDGNTITFASTEQLCACSGDNLCEVAIMLDDLLMGTLNFILHVERDPIAGGLTSETSIYNLTEQIDDIISGEGYVKDTDLNILQSDWNETDVSSPAYIKNKPGAALVDQADWTETDPLKQSYIKHKPDLKTVATTGSYNDLTDKPTIPTKTSELTNDSGFVESSDLATVATTGDYDDLLNKPAIPAAQVQSDWNQTNTSAVDYIKNKPDLMVVKTANGNPCTFETDLADNLVSLTADIVASGGGGTPSTPIPIVGYSSANITANGTTYTIAFGQTVYGGVLDVTRGKLHVTWGKQVYDGSVDESWGVYVSNYDGFNTTVNDMNVDNANPSLQIRTNIVPVNTDRGRNGTGLLIKTYSSPSDNNIFFLCGTGATTNAELRTWLASNNLEVVYNLATPFDIDLTPVQISALVGTNNITSNLGGDVEVRYVSGELAGQIIDICKMVIAEQGE